MALGAAVTQFVFYRPNGPVWSLVLFALAVPALDRWLPARPSRKESPVQPSLPRRPRSRRGRRLAVATAVVLAAALALPAAGHAFCGFYVSKADTTLFNRASQVVLVRDGDRTVITMANDFRGDPREFAVVIPVPTFVTREQIHVSDKAILDHLDAYTAPRLVEYLDPDPCAMAGRELEDALAFEAAPSAAPRMKAGSARSLGVRIEASYTVGEYDILILSAEESHGLETWLRRNGYRIPDGASSVLGSYLRQGMRFFVARVNLREQDRLGFRYLRPLQVAYETPKFMLPIRLGTVNADGPQELFIYTLTRTGRVETTNYRTVKLPTGDEVPVFVRDEFGDFYRSLFSRQVERENMRAVFLEYAWDMAWCDPCAADPLSPRELRELGVFWVPEASRGGPKGGARDVFVTRLHVRYDGRTFPSDLRFQSTGDRTNFQGRYVLRHAFEGEMRCAAADSYRRTVRDRQEREARTLASLTGWDLDGIRRRMDLDRWDPWGPRPLPEPTTGDGDPWYRRIWKD